MIDVLIIGSGGAGLTAALKAKENGSKVLVVSKTYPTHSQTCQAQGGINAVLNETKDDNTQNYINDTYKASHKLANQKNIKYLCENSKITLKWLDSIGVPFSRNEDSEIAQRKFGGTKAKRTCYSSDYTGLKILHTLYDQCIKEEIEFLNEHYLLDLVVEDNCVKGAIVLNMQTSELIQINAKTVILATGGYAGLYDQFTTNSFVSTGDGIAVALRAKAKLSNMEFIQFHPTTLENKNILISESARGEGGYLVDKDGNRFIDELKPRDEVARAIFKKNHDGKKVYLDLRHLGLEKIKEVMPQERRLVIDFLNLKMEEDLIPINPSAHYTMGGIETDIDAKTSITNLYACGECSQSGIHGANRLGGNSLLEIITFGQVAGKNASQCAKNIDNLNINDTQLKKNKKEIEEIFKKDSTIDYLKIKKEIGKLFFVNVGLFREERKLIKALDYIYKKKEEIEKIGIKNKDRIYNKNLIELLELKNLITLSEPILLSAIQRKESRGAHYRIDFKEKSLEYEKNSVCLLKEGKIENYFEDVL